MYRVRKYSKLTRRSVVANGKVRGDVASSVGETRAAAVDSSTADLGGTLPDDLRKVTPILKVGHVRVGLAVESAVVVDLAVVEQVGDDS